MLGFPVARVTMDAESIRRWWFVRVEHRVYWRVGRHARRVHGRGPLLVAIGDSLTDPEGGYTLPWRVWLRRVGRRRYRTVNLGVCGDTTADMRRRIDQTLRQGQPDVVVLFGGANDALFGVKPAETAGNVTFMVDSHQRRAVRHIGLIGRGAQLGTGRRRRADARSGARAAPRRG